MEGKGLRSLASCWPLLLLVFLLRSLGFGSSLNDEGRALLQFRGMVEEDPFAALLDWVAGEDTLDPCNWSGVKCENGKVAVLNLTGLYLKGTLAPDVVKLFHLRSLILCNNSFYGIIPKEFGEFQKLEILDLGYNKLSGFIPSDLGKMSSLKCLITRGNHFRGGVLPSEIHYPCVLSELEVVDNISMNGAPSMTRAGGYANIRRVLEQSQTKGSTNTAEPSTLNNSPSSHSSSSKDSSHSTGTSSPKSSPRSSPTPSAPSSPTSSEPSSHGPSAPRSPPPSPPSSPPSAPSSPTPSASSSRTPSAPSSPKTGFILLGVGIGTFCLFGLLVFFYYRCNKVVMVKPWTTGLSGQLQKAFVTGVPQLKRSELETACEDFSNIIDSLSDCKLYKGTLSSGVEIAVASTLIKSAKDWSKRADSQFRKKIATLSKVNHKNFVNLVGYCEDEEPFTRMLVFEYAPNGTLSDHLRVAEDLDWAARLRISMGIAYCLDYMHQLNSPVVLGNLQLSSIYLTDDFAAKVSDFEFWSQTTVDDSATGTSGPMEKQIAQPDSIVYSFGLLLLEIITGRPPAAASAPHSPTTTTSSLPASPAACFLPAASATEVGPVPPASFSSPTTCFFPEPSSTGGGPMPPTPGQAWVSHRYPQAERLRGHPRWAGAHRNRAPGVRGLLPGAQRRGGPRRCAVPLHHPEGQGPQHQARPAHRAAAAGRQLRKARAIRFPVPIELVTPRSACFHHMSELA